MNHDAIVVNKLTKKFNNNIVVNNVSLTIKQGTIFGFLGANGSGKTTTIRMMCGLLTPSSGHGLCMGYDITKAREIIKTFIGYMPQKFSLYQKLTVEQNMRFIADIYQLKNSMRLIKNMIDEIGIGEYRHIQAGNLSGGWKQRLALACCLLHQPKVIFLDEPTAGVDPKARREFWDYLHFLAYERNTTILVSTHYMDEAEKCTYLGYINRGNLLYQGTTANLITASGVHTEIIKIQEDEQGKLLHDLKQAFPKVLASIINNELRVSATKQDQINLIKKAFPKLKFQRVLPSFEEVFIGLMP